MTPWVVESYSRHNEMNQITENIWIGNSQDARNASALKSAGITHILNCAEDLPPALGWKDGFVNFHCGLCDGENPSAFYRGGIEILKGILDGSDHKVLVHCHEGRSRSVYIVACYMVCSDISDDIQSALQLIMEKGRDASVHTGHAKSFWI